MKGARIVLWHLHQEKVLQNAGQVQAEVLQKVPKDQELVRELENHQEPKEKMSI